MPKRSADEMLKSAVAHVPNCATCHHCKHDGAGSMICVHTRSLYYENQDFVAMQMHKMQFHSTAWMRSDGRPCGKKGELYELVRK